MFVEGLLFLLARITFAHHSRRVARTASGSLSFARLRATLPTFTHNRSAH
jgi:hypothetical protein